MTDVRVNQPPFPRYPKEIASNPNLRAYHDYVNRVILQLWKRTGGSEDFLDGVITANPKGTSTDNAMVAFDGTDGTKIKELPIISDLEGILTFTSQNNNIQSMIAPENTKEIFVSSDFDELESGGLITIDGTQQSWIIGNPEVIIPYPIRFLNRGRLSIKSGNGQVNLVFEKDSETFMSGDGSVSVTEVTLDSTGSGATLFNMNEGITDLFRSNVTGWSNLGAVSGSNLFLRFVQFSQWGAGLLVKNPRVFNVLTSGSITPVNNQTLFTYENDLAENSVVEFLGILGFLTPTTELIKIDPAILDSSRVSILSSNIKGTNLFNTDGADGTFTEVVDAAIASTAVFEVIDSPTTPGRARFRFSGPTVYVGQKLDLTGFTTSGYNGDRPITATDETSYFEFETVDYDATNPNDTGNFTSDSITLTDTGTTLSDGDRVDISSEFADDYDGGSIVYNVKTNSFQINRAVTVANPQTGTWSTRGLDRTDIKVLARTNINFLDSKYIACGFVNDNSTAVGTITNGVYTDLVFGTAGSALVDCTNTERFKLIDEINGTYEYIGNEPFDGVLNYSVTAVSSGGAQEFRFKFVKSTDGGSSYVDLDNPAIGADDIANTANNTGLVVPMLLDKGDLFKPQVTRVAGTSGLTIRFFSFAAQD